MRVHFQQLTEPIAFHNDHHELFEFSVTQSAFQIPTPTQLKSQPHGRDACKRDRDRVVIRSVPPPHRHCRN